MKRIRNKNISIKNPTNTKLMYHDLEMRKKREYHNNAVYYKTIYFDMRIIDRRCIGSLKLVISLWPLLIEQWTAMLLFFSFSLFFPSTLFTPQTRNNADFSRKLNTFLIYRARKCITLNFFFQTYFRQYTRIYAKRMWYGYKRACSIFQLINI